MFSENAWKHVDLIIPFTDFCLYETEIASHEI